MMKRLVIACFVIGLGAASLDCATPGQVTDQEASADASEKSASEGGADEDTPDSGDDSKEAEAEDNGLPEPPDGHTRILHDPGTELIPADAPGGGTLRRRINVRITSFNWVIENDATILSLSAYLNASIAERDPRDPNRWVPDLARRVTANEDRTEYIVDLRRGVTWQIPKPLERRSGPKWDWLDKDRELTAEDFVYTVRMMRHPDVEARGSASYYSDIDTIEAIDSHRLRVAWKRPVYHSRFTTLGLYPTPKWIYTRRRDGSRIPKAEWGKAFNDHWANDWPVGVGPYRLAEYRPGDRVVMERNERYHRTKPPIERLRFDIIFSVAKAFEKLKQDTLDLAILSAKRIRAELEGDDANSPLKTGQLRHRKVDRLAYHYIGWNMDEPMFRDRKARLAMTHALNRRDLVDDVLQGFGHIQTSPYPYDHAANHPEVEPWPFDLNRARELLDEAGWTDDDGDGVREKRVDGETVEFRFTMLAFNMTTTRRWTKKFSENLKKIGVRVRLRYLNWTRMKKEMNAKNFDAYVGGWTLGWSIDPYQIWHSSQTDLPEGSNRVGFRHDRADALIEKLRTTFDRDRRIELLREFHKILHRQQPYTFLFTPQDVWVWQPELRNVNFRKIRPQDYTRSWYIDPGARR